MKKPLVIFGGSGFVGQGIIQLALSNDQPVISLSKHGRPRNNFPLKDSPLMTWIAVDVLTETTWHPYLQNAQAVINLIGIIKETPAQGLTYDRMIVLANRLISQEVKKQPEIPYLFLSASAGGPGIPQSYLLSKRRAENELTELTELTNPVVIIRPGLVTSWQKPSTLVLGPLIYIASCLPLVGKAFKAVLPISRKQLSQCLYQQIETNTSQLIDLTKKEFRP